MLRILQEHLAKGPLETSILAIGGNTQVAVKVMIFEADEVGIVCQSKGMMGGYGEPHLRPWASIASLSLPRG